VNNKTFGFRSAEQQSWLIEFSNAHGNVDNFGSTEAIGDAIGSIQSSLSIPALGVGMGVGQCIAWIPASSNMAAAGAAGAAIGANILYRYENGTPTTEPLWDPVTRAFPCGAIVPGLNDGSPACADLHIRLGVTGTGCVLPPGYGN
jgi:hypothetical protein